MSEEKRRARRGYAGRESIDHLHEDMQRLRGSKFIEEHHDNKSNIPMKDYYS